VGAGALRRLAAIFWDHPALHGARRRAGM